MQGWASPYQEYITLSDGGMYYAVMIGTGQVRVLNFVPNYTSMKIVDGAGTIKQLNTILAHWYHANVDPNSKTIGWGNSWRY